MYHRTFYAFLDLSLFVTYLYSLIHENKTKIRNKYDTFYAISRVIPTVVDKFWTANRGLLKRFVFGGDIPNNPSIFLFVSNEGYGIEC